MTRRVFLSDLHLERADDLRFAAFTRCLAAECRWADEICILGDLCEMWIGDDDDSDLVRALEGVVQGAAQSARVRFLPGNRDFLLGRAFAGRAGLDLMSDPTRLPDGTLLAHGDAFCTGDAPYQALRETLRSPQWQRAMLARPLAERRATGEQLRARSLAANANKPDNIMDVSSPAVDDAMRRHDAVTLVHGHTHRPGVHVHPGGRRYVLGAWATCGWVVRQDAATFRLECFSLAAGYPGGPL